MSLFEDEEYFKKEYIPSTEVITDLYKKIEEEFDGKDLPDGKRFVDDILFRYCLKIEPDSERAKELTKGRDKETGKSLKTVFTSPEEFWLIQTALKIIVAKPPMKTNTDKYVYTEAAKFYVNWLLEETHYHINVTKAWFKSRPCNYEYLTYVKTIKDLRNNSVQRRKEYPL